MVNIGPKIGVDGEPEYRQAISRITQEARTLKSEMGRLAAEFDDNTSAQERLAVQGKNLRQQIELQKEKISEHSRMLAKSSAKYGENDIKTLKYKQVVNEATIALRQMERQLDDLPKSIDDVGDAMDDASVSTFGFGDALKAGTIIEGGKAIVSALMDIVENTEEYRKIMASLEVSSQRAGYTADQTAESYRLLYGVLDDDQSSATALANLQALKLSQDDLNVLITGTIGAWAAYGDSIPIDSLAEAINETVKVGKVTGTFADVLNWAGASEDEFNRKLAEATDEAARMDIVMQELARQGLVEVGEAWQQNNRNLVDANNAANDLNRAYARIAEMVAPAINTVQQSIADLLNTTLDLIEGDEAAVDSFIKSTSQVEQAAAENAQAVNETYANLMDALADAVASMIDSAASLEQEMKGHVQVMSDAFEEFVNDLQKSVNTSIASLGTLEAETASQSASIASYFAEMIPAGLEKLVSMMESAADLFSGAWEEASAAVASNAESVSSSTSSMAADVRSDLTALSGESPGWGLDLVSGFAGGIRSNQSLAARAASALAATVRSYLHFSVPDVGPLADADEYDPDFMKLLTKGITDNIPLVSAAAEKAAAAMVIQPQMTGAGATSNTVNRYGGFTINVYGAEGQGPDDIAEAVMDRLQTIIDRKETEFFV